MESLQKLSRRKEINKITFESDFIEYAKGFNVWENADFGELAPMKVLINRWEEFVVEKPKPTKKQKKRAMLYGFMSVVDALETANGNLKIKVSTGATALAACEARARELERTIEYGNIDRRRNEEGAAVRELTQRNQIERLEAKEAMASKELKIKEKQMSKIMEDFKDSQAAVKRLLAELKEASSPKNGDIHTQCQN